MRLFTDVASRVVDPYLARAAALAELGRGATAPNPLVGCVIVKAGEVVGEGYHAKAGLPHAEIMALRQAEHLAVGSDVYVTLEPCNHEGLTPPCTEALIAGGVRSVTIGMRDPNRIATGGVERLREAGIAVGVSGQSGPFVDLNEAWIKRVRTGIPFVTTKLGVSLDACLAFEIGSRASMTGPSGAVVTRHLRSHAEAVLVSAATVNADDPALTVRDANGVLEERQPLRVVLVREQLPAVDSRVFDRTAATLVLAASTVDEVALSAIPAHVQITRFPSSDGLTSALRTLAEHGVAELLVEPGPRLFSALWAEGLVDQLVTVTRGGMAGDAAATVFVGDGDRLGDALRARMTPREAGIVGDVVAAAWRPDLTRQ